MRNLSGFKRICKWVIAAGLFFAGCGVVGSSTVLAEGDPDYRIQISPARVELELEPGKTTTTKFKVQNTGAESFKFSLSVTPYSVSNEAYEQDFATTTKYNDLVKWITFSQDGGEIEPDGEVEVTATIKVPNDVPEGGQYAAIMARMLEPQTSNTTGISALKQVGMLVYAKNVDGNTRVTGGILENKVPSFMFAPPISATSVVENTGNVHMTAVYTLQVYPLFGDEEIYTNEENPDTKVILPDTKRVNTLSWDGSPQLGIFKVKQTVKFAGNESVTEKVVFICPIWFLFIILVLIFLIVFWIVSRVRGRKE